jgi:hypothetical protein
VSDIVVTIPRSRQRQVEAEERDLARRLAAGETGLAYFWALRQPPRRLKVGERVYFLWDCAVRAWHTVIGFDADLVCDYSAIAYRGTCILLDPVIHPLDIVRHMQPFRGFRYWSPGREG